MVHLGVEKDVTVRWKSVPARSAHFLDVTLKTVRHVEMYHSSNI